MGFQGRALVTEPMSSRSAATRCSADVLPDAFERTAACGACNPLAS
jgi:hypothetical protein